MFIKKDMRKIDEILNDPKDDRTVLKLSKRAPEFEGTLSILTRENRLKALTNLTMVNLYDNSITTLDGIGAWAMAPLEELNLGCNKLSSLPLEFGRLTQLKRLWLEDNEFETFPLSVCQLPELCELRMAGNQLTTVPANMSSMDTLVTLSLENNLLEDFPRGVLELPALKFLWLRQNRIREVPDEISTLSRLEVLSLSSNRLAALPDSVTSMGALTKLYLNGNRLERVPDDLTLLPSLVEVNVANNKLLALPPIWIVTWGEFDRDTGKLVGGIREGASVTVVGNAAVKQLKESPSKHM